MRSSVGTLIATIALIAVFVLAIMHSCTLYEECRREHSVPYCLHFIGK